MTIWGHEPHETKDTSRERSKKTFDYSYSTPSGEHPRSSARPCVLPVDQPGTHGRTGRGNDADEQGDKGDIAP